MLVIQVRSTDGRRLTCLNSYGEEYGTHPAGDWFDDEDLVGATLNEAMEIAQNVRDMYEQSEQQVEVRVMSKIVTYEYPSSNTVQAQTT